MNKTALVLFVVAIAGYVVVRDSHEPPDDPIDDRIGALDREVAELRAQIARGAPRVVRERTIVERDAPQQLDNHVPGPRVDLADVEAAVERQFVERFEREAFDDRWAPAQMRSVDDALRATATHVTSIGPVECRSASCRFEAVFASMAEYNAFFDRLATTPGLQFGQLVAPHVDVDSAGAYHVEFFLTRNEPEQRTAG